MSCLSRRAIVNLNHQKVCELTSMTREHNKISNASKGSCYGWTRFVEVENFLLSIHKIRGIHCYRGKFSAYKWQYIASIEKEIYDCNVEDETFVIWNNLFTNTFFRRIRLSCIFLITKPGLNNHQTKRPS